MTSPIRLAERVRRSGALAAACLLIAGCGTSTASPGAPAGSGAPNQSAAIGNLPDLGLKSVTTETAQARAAMIGSEGGTLTARADDGTTFSLRIPAGAIDKPTQVSLYPVSGLAGLAQGSTLTAGAQFAPEGLQLLLPATLTIGLKAAPDPQTVHGLVWNGDATDVHAYPARLDGASATITVYHFSGAGLGNPPLVSITNCATQSQMDQEITDAIHAAATGATDARDQFTRTLKLCYANLVKGALTDGASLSGPGDIVEAAAVRTAYDTWLGGSTFWAAGFFPGFTVSPEVADSKVLAAKYLRNWFDTSNAACVSDAAEPSKAVIDASAGIGLPHRYAPVWGIDTRANKLDYETLLNDLCVKVVIDPSRTFSGSKPGDAGTVTVPVGYSVNGQPVLHDLAIHVSLKETGGSSPFAEDDAPADGRYAAPYTWPSTVNPLKIDVLASLADYPDIAVFDRITKHPGSKLALVVRNASNETAIVVMNEDGTHATAVTAGPADSWPTWSPDGTQIAFARQTVGGGTSTTSVQVVNADGAGLKALTSGPFDSGPAWAPDGSRIAFVRSSATGTTLVLMNPDGTNVVDTGVKVVGAKVSWSPDSRQIVYSNYDPDGSGTVRLWVWPVAGGSSTMLVTHACEPWGATAPEWSSTGTIGFFCDTHGNPNGNLWLATMSATGGGYEAVTGNLIGKVIGGPTWSPDGTKFARVESGGIVITDAAGGSPTKISAAGGTVVGLDWGP